MINDEMTIDLKDLCLRVLKRWKFIVLWVLACALVCGALGAVKNYRSYQAELRAQESAGEVDELAALQNSLGLSDWQVAEAERAAESYFSFKSEYEETLSYIENSPVMKMDANSVSYQSIQYSIVTENTVYPVIEEQDDRDAILTALLLRTVNDENKKSYASILVPGVDEAYSSELFSSWVDAEKNTLCITFYGETEEACREVAQLIDESMSFEMDRLQNIYGEFQLVQLYSNFYRDVLNKDILSLKQTQYNSLNVFRTSMMNAGSSLTTEQKGYYAALLEAEQMGDQNEAAELEQARFTVRSVINKKFIALGLVLGVVVSCGWIVMKYILSKTLRISDELKEGFGLQLIGEMKCIKHREDVESVKLMASRIYLDCVKKEHQKLYLTGEMEDPDVAKLVGILENFLSEKKILLWSGDIVRSPEAVEELIGMDAVVLIERIGVSTYRDIGVKCDICRRSGVELLGAVVIV